MMLVRFVPLILFLSVSGSVAQDVVILKTEDGKTTKRNGMISDWKGDQLSLKTQTRTRKIDASKIIEVQTNWPEELLAARALMSTGKFEEAIKKLNLARQDEGRKWVQQIVTAELIQCLDATDQLEQASIEFLRLYQDDEQTRFFHLIPLPWLLTKPYPPGGKLGTKILRSKNNLLALIAASLLLSGNQRELATTRLEQLTSDPDRRIAQLAITQLWRNDLLSADETTIERWRSQLNALPFKLRAGPNALLAQAQQRVGQENLAMTNFMKLPILHPDKQSLAALALFRCSEILQDSGQAKLAASLQEELFRDYPTSQYAERARQK